MKSKSGWIALGVLAVLYSITLLAPFLAPYNATDQDLKKTFHPPTRVFWKDAQLWVSVYENVDPTASAYQEKSSVPLQFFAPSQPYTILGIPLKHKLFGVEPGQRVYLLGSDSTGRDVFSRLLLGARISMTLGLVGVSVTLVLGTLIGGMAGYFGGWVDNVIMRGSEFLMAIPGLYLLLALRSAFAQHFDSGQMFFLIVIILSALGWTGTARVVRGMCLSLRQRAFVQAAEVLGQSPLQVIARHFLPNMLSYLLVSAAMSIPSYILGEAALSFLNIGIQEPTPSWGLMLSQAQDIKVFMLNFWWLLTPGLAIFITVLAFNVLGDALRDWADPRTVIK